MNLEHLYSAVDLVRGDCAHGNPREVTALRTYPVLVATARLPARDAEEAFLRTACLAFAWMPERIRLVAGRLTPAVAAFEGAQADVPIADARAIAALADGLSSLVGATIVLHLANPNAFPIWDEEIERARIGDDPSSYHMSQADHYLAFIDEIRELSSHPLFLTFHHDYCTAYQARLQRWQIRPYPLTEPRVVESAMRELAPD
jgi:hypothetical protein